MWGGLWRPEGPFQVICVLAAAVLAAGFSTTTDLAQPPPQGRGGSADVDSVGCGNLDAVEASVARHRSAVRGDGDSLSTQSAGRMAGRRA
jgi:hypothetical protein